MALFVRSSILSSNVAYILDRDRHLITRELVNDESTKYRWLYLSKSGILSSNVAYILDRDRHLITRELVNDGSTKYSWLYLSKSGILSLNVGYILDRDHHLMTCELVNNGSTNTVCFFYPIFLRGCEKEFLEDTAEGVAQGGRSERHGQGDCPRGSNRRFKRHCLNGCPRWSI